MADDTPQYDLRSEEVTKPHYSDSEDEYNSIQFNKELELLKGKQSGRQRGNQMGDTDSIDPDRSGNYDPTQNLSCVLPRLPRKRKVENIETDNNKEAKKPKSFAWQKGRHHGRHFPVTLKITSESTKAWLRSVGADLDNWPEPSSQDERNSVSNQGYTSSNMRQPTDDGNLPYKLRERTGPPIRDVIAKSHGLDVDLSKITLGHPEARGCKMCVVFDVPCDLLSEGAKFPCAHCNKEEVDCEPITEFKEKRGCEACSQAGTRCSYKEVGSNHALPCRRCNDRNFLCIAGPKNRRTRTEPALNQGIEPSKGQRPDFSDQTVLGLRAQDSSFGHNSERLGGFTSRDNAMSHDNTHDNTTRPKQIITTRLAHPILFNHDFVANNEACNWCEDLSYGLVGLPVVDAVVIDRGDGKGLVEIGHGHASAGYQPSRMCSYCTYDRLKITTCDGHQFRRIKGMDPDFNMEYWLDPSRVSQTPFEWCSVCPTPALHRCVRKGKVEKQEIGHECGLTLCEACFIILTVDHDVKLDKLIDESKVAFNDEGYGVRADADLLHSGGELMQRSEA